MCWVSYALQIAARGEAWDRGPATYISFVAEGMHERADERSVLDLVG
jgi:hypothetical protein